MIVIFWCDAAGFSSESIKICSKFSSSNSVSVVKGRLEEYWKERFAFHMMVKEVGMRLLRYANSIGEDFDVFKPLAHMSKNTGKY